MSTVRVLIAVLCVLFASSLVVARIPSDKVIDTIINTYLKENFGDLADSQASYAAQAAASYAQDQVGACYSQANRLGNPCFDCSGLVYMAYKSGGKTVPSSSSGYPNSAVYDVTGKSMEVGDILWRSGHVGIYVGGNQVVSAENSRTGVQQRDIGYYSKYLQYTKVYRVY